jgi:hypothetical protein
MQTVSVSEDRSRIEVTAVRQLYRTFLGTMLRAPKFAVVKAASINSNARIRVSISRGTVDCSLLRTAVRTRPLREVLMSRSFMRLRGVHVFRVARDAICGVWTLEYEIAPIHCSYRY